MATHDSKVQALNAASADADRGAGTGKVGHPVAPCAGKGNPADPTDEKKCHLRIFVQDEHGNAIANESYELEIDRAVISKDTDQTDASGMLYKEIPCGAKAGKLTVRTHVWQMQIEEPPPYSWEEGARVRLANLGYLPDANKPDAADLKFAYWDFQRANAIARSAKLDDSTVMALDKIHG